MHSEMALKSGGSSNLNKNLLKIVPVLMFLMLSILFCHPKEEKHMLYGN